MPIEKPAPTTLKTTLKKKKTCKSVLQLCSSSKTNLKRQKIHKERKANLKKQKTDKEKSEVKMAADRAEYYGNEDFDGCDCCRGRLRPSSRSRPPLEFDMSFDFEDPRIETVVFRKKRAEVEAEKVVTVTDAECLIAITRIALDKRTDGGSAVLPLPDKIKY
ncbi:unnamed protein product [Brassica oleracea]